MGFVSRQRWTNIRWQMNWDVWYEKMASELMCYDNKARAINGDDDADGIYISQYFRWWHPIWLHKWCWCSCQSFWLVSARHQQQPKSFFFFFEGAADATTAPLPRAANALIETTTQFLHSTILLLVSLVNCIVTNNQSVHLLFLYLASTLLDSANQNRNFVLFLTWA